MNPTKFDWVIPTTNVDGTAIGAGEITGFEIGVRSTTAAGSAAGTYPISATVTDPTATSATIASTVGALKADSYAASVRAIGPNDSGWSTEATFTVSEVPSPPTGFSVA